MFLTSSLLLFIISRNSAPLTGWTLPWSSLFIEILNPLEMLGVFDLDFLVVSVISVKLDFLNGFEV